MQARPPMPASHPKGEGMIAAWIGLAVPGRPMLVPCGDYPACRRRVKAGEHALTRRRPAGSGETVASGGEGQAARHQQGQDRFFLFAQTVLPRDSRPHCV
jgi:hypothetical protein